MFIELKNFLYKTEEIGAFCLSWNQSDLLNFYKIKAT